MRSCLLRSAEPAGVRNKQENHPRQRQHSDVSGAERPTWRTSKRQRGDDGGARECGSHPLGEAAFRTASIAPGGHTSLSKAVVIRHSAIRRLPPPHLRHSARTPSFALSSSSPAPLAHRCRSLRRRGRIAFSRRAPTTPSRHRERRFSLFFSSAPSSASCCNPPCPGAARRCLAPYCCTGAVVKAWSALGVEFVQHEDRDLHAGIPRGTAPEPCDVRMAGLAFSADPHWGLRRPLATRPLLKLWDLATPYYIASESPYRVWRRTSFTP
ncbi:hypothetical protein IOCL2690_000192200 [Leishmania lindenbergi]|uniref:Uncharacterized protein n=1 Tax=Leishmania lindenbergi TaxID=651832 RepID=A0AAW3ASR0_9TRYP